jgi:hypothetical protein
MEQYRAIELVLRDPSSPESQPSLPLYHTHHLKLFVHHTITSGVAGLTKASHYTPTPERQVELPNMSNYADHSRYSQVAQEAQLAHYRLPTGGVPRPHGTRAGEYKGTIPSRKPVKTGTARNQDGPYPSMAPTPARKPVGGYRTVSSSSGVRPQSEVYARSDDYAGQNKPLPPVPGAPSKYSPAQPLTRNQSLSRTHQPSRPPQSAQPSQSRPGSSSGWSFRGRKRNDSNASNASNASGASTTDKKRSRSRGGSFSSVGKWLSKQVEIVAMTPKEREALFATSQRQHAQELELQRKRGEKERPLHQKQELTRRSSGLENPSATVGVAGYEALQQQKADRQRRAAAYQKQHARDCEEAARAGRRRPSTPQMAKLSPPQRKDSFTPSMDEDAHARFGGGVDRKANRPRPTAGTKYSLLLSQAMDPFKRKDSDASLWLSDAAPPGSMDYCTKCSKAPEKALQNDLCENCHRARYFGK